MPAQATVQGGLSGSSRQAEGFARRLNFGRENGTIPFARDWLVGAMLTLLAISTALAADDGGPKQWAVLIGVQEHEDARLNLRYTANDVRVLRQVLVDRAGIPESRILAMSDDSPQQKQPTLANLRREVPRFLAQADPEDQVLVFFSGHGELFEQKTYLIPKDFKHPDPKTALPAAELRKALDACPAAVKLLVIDSCHAGGARSGETTLPAEALARSVVSERVAGCVVLASSRADEKSWEWPQRQQGIFSYWLCRALEGGADKNNDGRLTVDEVYEYTSQRVAQTARQVFHRDQTPVRIIGGDVEGVPTVLRLRPEPPESLMRRMAEHLDLEIRRSGLKRVGVLEFMQPIGWSEALGHANLPAYCAGLVRDELIRLSDDRYVVLGEAATKEAAKGLRVEALGDPDQMRPLRDGEAALDALVVGSLRRRGRNMHVQCDLIATADGNSLATPSGVLPLSEDLVGDTGHSFVTSGRPPGGPYAPEVVAHVQASQDHPMLQAGDRAFPFRLEIWSIEAKPGEPITDSTPRKRKDLVVLTPKSPATGETEPKRSELVVAAREGEMFEIRVRNRYRQRVAMTLLVDGLNMLGQKRERLGKGWSWVLRPAEKEGEERVHRFTGWHLPKQPTAKAGETMDFDVRQFQFVDMADSAAGRQGFGDSIGLITAAFYAERGRMLGVGEGPEEQRSLRTADFQPGRLLGVIHVRYVDERELERLKKGE